METWTQTARRPSDSEDFAVPRRSGIGQNRPGCRTSTSSAKEDSARTTRVPARGSGSGSASPAANKRVGDELAVDAVDFEVHEGEVFGFLGPNGAGNTTTINMLTGLARPTTGTIRFFGHDVTRNVKKVQHLVGVVPDGDQSFPELDGAESLCFCASLYGMDRRDRQTPAGELLEQFVLTEVAKREFAVYSRGMKRKLTIAAGIIHQPPILFLDEPTTGIDVASARQIRQLLAALNKAGTTVLLTTQYIEETERLCERLPG
jgi:ABC-2 type transport system ATP-binding protein